MSGIFLAFMTFEEQESKGTHGILLDQSENCKFNLIPVDIRRIGKHLLCV